MSNKITKNNSGISILEVVVAILIIAVGMIGVLSLVIQNVEAQYINKNVLIASGLAQEGLELVRNSRDLNWLTAGNDWKLGIGAGLTGDIIRSGNNYAIDYTRAIKAVNAIETDARLYIDNSGFYTHTETATPTNFYRYITVAVAPIDATHDYLDVRCTIRWKDGTQNHDYVGETYLYNWR